ncbi:MAG: nitroreductase [bacterium]|nr:nitroreductase [bacterium]
MDIMTAIEKRISVRSYDARPVEPEKIEQIASLIEEINVESGLKFQLYGPRDDGEPSLPLSTKMFAGVENVQHYAALVAPDDVVWADKLGYYGEKLVLFATQLGLGTCWVAGTYDPSKTRAEVGDGERLWDVIPLGYATEKVPMKQRMIRAGIRKSDKKLAELVDADVAYDELPDWFKSALDSVSKGPSAVNEQPVVFVYREGEVKATLPAKKRDLEFNDLGIAKLHFELAAAAHGINGKWEWGDDARFVLE